MIKKSLAKFYPVRNIPVVLAIAALLYISVTGAIGVAGMSSYTEKLMDNQAVKSVVSEGKALLAGVGDSSKVGEGDVKIILSLFGRGYTNSVYATFDKFCGKAIKTLDVAFYNLGDAHVAETLMKAKQRGVSVRIVVDSDAVKQPAVAKLQRGGVEVVSDQRRSKMNHKFMVADSQWVWIGSGDAVTKDLKRNVNYLTVMFSPALAKAYVSEFMEMFDKRIFGQGGIGEVNLARENQMVARVGFSPEGRNEKFIVSRIKAAQKEIVFASRSMTSARIAKALMDARRKGVEITGVVDALANSKGNKRAQAVKLIGQGLNIHRYGNGHVRMNYNAMVIDGKYLFIGSYQWTRVDEFRNDGNMLTLRNGKLASDFKREIMRLFNKGKRG